ncbi:hypothetical protein BDZ89DRAFT_1150181 [Hymenopellis radicata]|nr:hypothetical protein BDZ89DRAFT_1150181 [Hymenopellis radicata]
MSVPMLLGEDYQLTYEITTKRSVSEGTRIAYGNDDALTVKAEAVSRSKDISKLRASAYALQSFVKAKLHRRNKHQRQHRKYKMQTDELTIRAAKEIKIKPHHTCNVEVMGPFDTEKVWLVDRTLIEESKNSYLAIPNVLISSSHPIIPISNPSGQPKIIRKGEALAVICEASNAFQHPRSEEEKEAMTTSANLISAVVNLQIAEDEAREASHTTSETSEEEEREEEYGPKTAAMPDPTIYPSEKIKELL